MDSTSEADVTVASEDDAATELSDVGEVCSVGKVLVLLLVVNGLEPPASDATPPVFVMPTVD